MSEVRLYEHQLYGLSLTQGFKNCALYWDMGLGKTFGGSEKMKEYNNQMNLVICQTSKVKDWVEHLKHYYAYNVYDLTNKKDFAQFVTILTTPTKTNSHVGVINYELVWRRPKLLHMRGFTLMLDESSLIQNPSAKRTKFILKMIPKNVILLSGTPTAGKYENMWTQAHLLGWGISKGLYDKHYINWKTVENEGFVHKIVDMDNPYKNVGRLRRKLREYGAVFMKSDVAFDLPEQTIMCVDVPSVEGYQEFVKTGYIEFSDGGELIGDRPLTKRLYARQLCGMYNPCKVVAFEELLQSTNDRVIVFYNFTGELDILMPRVMELGRCCSVVNGFRKDLENYEKYEDSVTFVQYQAGAMGLDLQKANKMIYFTLPERSDLFEQSKARISRIGQEKRCFYWILQCKDSIEGKIYEALRQRKDFTDELF